MVKKETKNQALLNKITMLENTVIELETTTVRLRNDNRVLQDQNHRLASELLTAQSKLKRNIKRMSEAGL